MRRNIAMGKVDHFESIFRATTRHVFRYAPPRIASVLVITDLAETRAATFTETVRGFLSGLEADGEVRWRTVRGDEYETVQDLLDLVGADAPDLICTYRNLRTAAWEHSYTLGDHLVVVTQETDVPVMVLPHPGAGRAAAHAMENTDRVMAITDHMAGDDRLVNYAARFTEHDGVLFLTHVENQAVFDRYIDVISKISEIETDVARELIMRRLLKEPRDFIALCAETLASQEFSVRVETIVTVGNHLREYASLIEEHQIDLLILNAKDKDQLAMHGLAYPLAVQLRHIPLLML